MSLSFSIDVEGVREAAAKLQGVGRRAAQPQPVFEAIGNLLQRGERRLFQSRGGGEWPPLAERTREMKRDRGQTSRPLVATERLFDSLTKEGAAGAIREASSELYRFGTEVEYAHFHQYGTKQMPQRRVIEVDEPAENAITEIMRRYIARGGLL